jgi:hypothetical protein
VYGESSGKTDHKDGSGCHGDQIDGPRVLAFTDKV